MIYWHWFLSSLFIIITDITELFSRLIENRYNIHHTHIIILLLAIKEKTFFYCNSVMYIVKHL